MLIAESCVRQHIGPDRLTIHADRGPAMTSQPVALLLATLLSLGRLFETLQAAFPFATQGSLRTLGGVFGFSGDDVDKSCRVLSGGEKARVVLAMMLYDPPNFLVLDEPTNHLDMQTKETLLNALADFEGTMLFVSHDRQFLGALSNRVLELADGKVKTYGGGYKEYVAATGHEAPGVS